MLVAQYPSDRNSFALIRAALIVLLIAGAIAFLSQPNHGDAHAHRQHGRIASR
jgi:hypothetical protein